MDLFIDTKDLDRLHFFVVGIGKQLPYAQSRALNSLAYETRDQTRSGMRSNFTIRRPWVVNQLQVRKKASKSDLEAVVGTSDKGKFLAKHEDGGTRPALGRFIAIPTRAVRRTKTDQIRKSDRPSNLGDRAGIVSYKGNQYLALKRGRWQKTGGGSFLAPGDRSGRLLYLLKPRVDIDERLELEKTGRRVVSTQATRKLSEAIEQALRTAK
jgi:hypothetical protein